MSCVTRHMCTCVNTQWCTEGGYAAIIILKILGRKIAQIDKPFKNVVILVVLAKSRFDWTLKTHRTSKIVLFFVRNDPKSETKSSKSSKIIKIGLFSLFSRLVHHCGTCVQSVLHNMAGVETCFLELSEELNWRNQVQKM